MTAAALLLNRLQQTAELAAAEETAYRREAQARIAVLEEKRAFAYRRANLMRALCDAVRPPAQEALDEPVADVADEEDMAIARGLALLRTRLGWSSDSESRSDVLARFAPLAAAFYRALRPASGGAEPAIAEDEIATELSAFESWYEDTHQISFWTLFETEMPETPRVDF